MSDEIKVGSRWHKRKGATYGVRIVRHVENGFVCWLYEKSGELYVTTSQSFLNDFQPMPIIDESGWYVRRDGLPAYVAGKYPFNEFWITGGPYGEYLVRPGGNCNKVSECQNDIIAKWQGPPPKSFDERQEVTA